MQGYLMTISAIVRGCSSHYSSQEIGQLSSVYEFILHHLADFTQFSLKGFSYLIKSACVFVDTVFTTDLHIELATVSEKLDKCRNIV
jgi:hypothetical protein